MTTVVRAPDQDGIWREKIIPDGGGANVLAMLQFGGSAFDAADQGLIAGAGSGYLGAIPGREVLRYDALNIPANSQVPLAPAVLASDEMAMVGFAETTGDSTDYGWVGNQTPPGVSVLKATGNGTPGQVVFSVKNGNVGAAITVNVVVWAVKPLQALLGNVNPLDSRAWGVTPYAGKIRRVSWKVQNGDANTKAQLYINNVAADEIATPNVGNGVGVVTGLDIAVNAGDIVAVAYRSGGIPDWMTIEVPIEAA